jgi:hypothetical protein
MTKLLGKFNLLDGSGSFDEDKNAKMLNLDINEGLQQDAMSLRRLQQQNDDSDNNRTFNPFNNNQGEFNRGGPGSPEPGITEDLIDDTVGFGGDGGGVLSNGPTQGGSEASEQDMSALTMTALYCIPIVLVIGCIAGGLLYPRAAKACLRKCPCLSDCACLQESQMSPEEKKGAKGDSNGSNCSRQSSQHESSVSNSQSISVSYSASHSASQSASASPSQHSCAGSGKSDKTISSRQFAQVSGNGSAPAE